ncbi:MAG: hypothetical protein HY319_30970 [Armatimonadetes bacterium]|nr:hypothetical protein [Armatimonadota bacterium]
MAVDVYTYYENRMALKKPIELTGPIAEPQAGETVALLLLAALYGTGILAALALFFTRSPFVALLMGAVGALVGPIAADFGRSLRRAPAPRRRT